MTNTDPKKIRITSIKKLDQLKQYMVDEGLITEEKLIEAETIAKHDKKPLKDVLIKSNFLTEDNLTKFIAKWISIPYVDLKHYEVDRKALGIVPEKIARRYRILPLFVLEGVLTIAMANPLDIISLDEISAVVEYKVEPAISSEESIDRAIDQWYGMEI